MEQSYEQLYHAIERRHWWFKGRRNAVLKLLTNSLADKIILDIGCASGALLEDLTEKKVPKQNLFGIDISESGIAHCKKNNFEQTQVMDAQNLKFEHKFDVMVASDCLEHLQYDEQALKSWHNHLKPNGQLIVFVPAFMFLWSQHDVDNMHYRRYTKNELKQKLQNAGFSVKSSGYWNSALFIPIAAARWLQNNLLKVKQNKNSGQVTLPNKFINTALLTLLNIENFWITFLPNIVGVSTFCVAIKQD